MFEVLLLKIAPLPFQFGKAFSERFQKTKLSRQVSSPCS